MIPCLVVFQSCGAVSPDGEEADWDEPHVFELGHEGFNELRLFLDDNIMPDVLEIEIWMLPKACEVTFQYASYGLEAGELLEKFEIEL